MPKAKVYIESSIPSYLVSRPSVDPRTMASQEATREWWDSRRASFDLFISEIVIAEAALGDPEAARNRLASIEGLVELEISDKATLLASALMSDGPIPAKAEIDALHIAIAAVHGMDYLLTWNCSHIANAAMRTKIERVCRKHGSEPPIMCTPLELMEG